MSLEKLMHNGEESEPTKNAVKNQQVKLRRKSAKSFVTKEPVDDINDNKQLIESNSSITSTETQRISNLVNEIPKPPSPPLVASAPPPPPPPSRISFPSPPLPPGVPLVPGPPPPPGSGPPVSTPLHSVRKRGSALKPTKPHIKPSGLVKAFMWKRILIDKKSARGKFWRNVDQIIDVDFNKLEDSFQNNKKPIVQARASKLKGAEFVAQSNLPAKKAQAIEIYLKSSNINIKTFLQKLYSFEFNKSDILAIKFFKDQFLTKEEYENIKRAELKIGTNKLLNSERVMMIVYEFPQSLLRIRIIQFILSSETPIKAQSFLIDKVSVFLKEIQSNPMLKKLISIILTCGNFLNGNNVSRCQADGFNLDMLTKASSFKTTDLKSNLLEFCVDEYISKHTKNIHTQFFNPPFPQPESYERLGDFTTTQSEKEIGLLKSDMNALKKELIKLTADEQDKKTQEIIDELILDAQFHFEEVESLINDVELKIENLKNLISDLVKEFSDREIEREQNPEQKLIEIWSKFLKDINSIWRCKTAVKFEQFYRDLEMVLKERRKEVKIQTRKSVVNDRFSLKNKIKRLSLSSANLSDLQDESK